METSDGNNKVAHSFFSECMFYFHVQRSFKHTIIYTYLSLLMWSIM